MWHVNQRFATPEPHRKATQGVIQVLMLNGVDYSDSFIIDTVPFKFPLTVSGTLLTHPCWIHGVNRVMIASDKMSSKSKMLYSLKLSEI